MRPFDTCDFIAVAGSMRWAEVHDFFPHEESLLRTNHIPRLDRACPRTVGSCGLPPDEALMINEQGITPEQLELNVKFSKIAAIHKNMDRLHEIHEAAKLLSVGREHVSLMFFTEEDIARIKEEAERIKIRREKAREAQREYQRRKAKEQAAYNKRIRQIEKDRANYEKNRIANAQHDPGFIQWQQDMADNEAASAEKVIANSFVQVRVISVEPDATAFAKLPSYKIKVAGLYTGRIYHLHTWRTPPRPGDDRTIALLPDMPPNLQWRLMEIS